MENIQAVLIDIFAEAETALEYLDHADPSVDSFEYIKVIADQAIDYIGKV